MPSQILLAVLMGLASPVGAQAEPAKAPVTKAEQVSEQQPVVVAAASPDSRVEISKADQATDAGAKPRRARVTTCRCGDQTPNSN